MCSRAHGAGGYCARLCIYRRVPSSQKGLSVLLQTLCSSQTLLSCVGGAMEMITGPSRSSGSTAVCRAVCKGAQTQRNARLQVRSLGKQSAWFLCDLVGPPPSSARVCCLWARTSPAGALPTFPLALETGRGCLSSRNKGLIS